MKRFLLILLSAILLTACNSNSTDVSKDKELNTPEQVATAEAIEKDEKITESNGSDNHQTNTSVAPATNLIKAEVVKVTDGDTIKVLYNGKEESVRFLLVDTPETSHPKLGKQPYGEEAKAFVQEMLSGGFVELEKDVTDRDKYGRLLMYVYVDDVSLQEELLRNGLARVAYVYAPNTKHVDKYYEIQKEAQANGVGIWSIENYATDSGFDTSVFEQEKSSNASQSSSSSSPSSSADSTSGECNIKGNISSSGEKIYHMPGQQFYDKTQIDKPGEQLFCSAEEAEQAGFRASLR